MTRWIDPTAERTVASRLVELVRNTLMYELTDQEREIVVLRYGLRDGQPRTSGEIASALQLPDFHVLSAMSNAATVLQRVNLAEHLHDFAQDDAVGRLPKVLRDAFVVDDPGSLPDLVYCERHGWSDPTGVTQCAACPCRVVYSLIGRRPQYCSDACRQAAYRLRRAASLAG